MSKVFSLRIGNTPLLISVPHDGWQIPTDIVQYMSNAGRGIPDTDWHVAQLYDFASERGASMLVAHYSRYVVDLNRPADDAALYPGQLATGLCPLQTFAGRDIYLDPIDIDQAARVEAYWRPYHDQLTQSLALLREQHGYALLWDAHSIVSRVPTLFDGDLPVLNIGTWDGRSCDPAIAAAVMSAAGQSDYDAVLNGRFKGGYTTRHYGDPDNGVHALQLELAQRSYMHEVTLDYDRGKATKIRVTLNAMLDAYEGAGRQ
ncbi:MAG: N-formylglutamate deformylase [Proteobacteria bacterium]|nr:N-formylglutamate deformylase [Pseudomonadota bacterium]MDA1062848.1 N-formylglutamate deformylase [Pseudomonadota bacterium]